jgi:hypothetical protein
MRATARRCKRSALLVTLLAGVALAVGVWLALPASADTTYVFCDYQVPATQVCHGARHTLYYIDVYTIYSNGSVGEFAETSVDNGNPLKEKFGYNDVNSGSDWYGNGSLLYPYGKNADCCTARTIDAYDLVH